MAQQAGPLRLKGRLGDLSFYHNKQYGYLIRQKGGPSKELVKTSLKFERTRENNSEFARAVSAGKLIRRAIRGTMGLEGDSNVSQRFTSLLIQLGKKDLLSPRGMRSPVSVINEPESRELMKSFSFFEGRPVTKTFRGQIHCDLAGSILFTGDITPESFNKPGGATHVRIKGAIIDFDFAQNTYSIYPAAMYTSSLEIGMALPNLTCGLIGAENAMQRFGVVAIEFLQEQNGELYLLKDGVSLAIVG